MGVDTPDQDPGTPPEGAEEPRWDRRRTVGAVVGGAIVLGIVLLLVVGLANKDLGTSIQDALEKGKRPDAPAFELPVIASGDGIGPTGSTVSLADLKGRIVVLNFWASWCSPCKDEAPILEEVARRYRLSGDVKVVGVDVQDLREKAVGFIRDQGLTYPSLRDGGGDVQQDFQVPALPETFVIDQQGRIALHVSGGVRTPLDLTTAIEQLRAEAS